MFVKHQSLDRFDPVIARYYPDNANSIEDFKDISYDGIPYDWSGKVDIWTYDERHFIGFIYEKGNLSAHFRYGRANSNSLRIQSDCQEITREVTYTTVDDDGILTVHGSTVKLTTCFGSGGYTPQGGGDGSTYYDYERSTCCVDPITAPTRDAPSYDPPSIPSPDTILNQLTNPCASAILFKQLSKGSQNLTATPSDLGALNILPGMLDLFKQSGKFDYRIQNGFVSNGANAITQRINGINVITLNNDYLAKATSLSIARTIIHETVHAYLLENTYNMDLRYNHTTFDLLLRYFEKYDQNWNDTHHAAMGDFILGMAVSLYNWDKNFGPTGGTLGFDYYFKMAFGGLLNPDNPTQLIDEAKQYIPKGSSWSEIDRILKNEANGNNQANGTKCN